MKRWPLVASFLLFLLLCASLAYWGLQLFKPPLRPVAAPPPAAAVEARPEAGAALFGGRGAKTAVASNYQLRGVILSGTPRASIAILGADGKPAQALRVDAEVLPGVVVKEVHRDHVLLSDGGVIKRVDLPEEVKTASNAAAASPLPPARTVTPPSVSPPRTGMPPSVPPRQSAMPSPSMSVVTPHSAQQPADAQQMPAATASMPSSQPAPAPANEAQNPPGAGSTAGGSAARSGSAVPPAPPNVVPQAPGSPGTANTMSGGAGSPPAPPR